MELSNEFRVAVPAAKTWEFLTDVERVAPCLPGATLLSVDGDEFTGAVKVKVGPATANFSGDVQLLEIDPSARRLRISAIGADRGSSASMDLTASLEIVDEQRSVLVGSSRVIVNGKFAQFGGRLIGQVSDVVLAQFANNFAAAAAALPRASAVSTAAEGQATGAAAPRKTELSALAIVWGLVKNWVLALFGKRA